MHSMEIVSKEDGGTLKIIIVSIISLVMFFTIATNIIENIPIKDIIINIIPFILIVLTVVIVPIQYSSAIVFLLIAIGTSIDPENISDYSGSIFFIYSYHMIKGRWYGIITIFLTIVSVTIRTIRTNEAIPQALIILLIYFFIYSIYYLIILKQFTKPIKSKLKNLTTDENTILELMCNGESQENAGAKIGHKDKHETSKVMSKIREKLDIKNNESSYKAVAMYAKNSRNK